MALPCMSIRARTSGSMSLKGNMSCRSATRDSGAHPWHLDGQTESIMFLTNMSSQIVRVGFRVDVLGKSYFLTKLRLSPHETRTIDIRKLRDAQIADFKGTLLPAAASDRSASDGAVDRFATKSRNCQQLSMWDLSLPELRWFVREPRTPYTWCKFELCVRSDRRVHDLHLSLLFGDNRFVHLDVGQHTRSHGKRGYGDGSIRRRRKHQGKPYRRHFCLRGW
jgi:hypothetical protein